MSVVRMARVGDLDGLVNLASNVDGYMTTMPKSVESMRHRISNSINSLAKQSNLPDQEVYLFVLEQMGKVIGVSAVYSAVGKNRPFYSYRVTNVSTTSPELGIRKETKVLNLVNDFNGFSEVATLFIHPDYRSGGRGILLSWARFMFMAVHRERFPERALAEIRGWTDKQGNSPFWEAVGKRFFEMEMGDADKLSGDEFRFMADLMPKLPIYIDLLPTKAQQVIGKPNDTAIPAVKMLEKQGFKYEGQVDIFDAGICVEAWIDHIKVVNQVRKVKASATQKIAGSYKHGDALVANLDLNEFRVIRTTVGYQENWLLANEIMIETGNLEQLKLTNGNDVYVYML